MTTTSPATRPAAADEPLRFAAISPRFGAEVAGIQLAGLDDAGVVALAQLAAERGVVVARGQQMTVEEQIALGRRLGPVQVHPAFADRDHPEVLVIHADEHSKVAAGEAWHSDVSFEPVTPALSMLRLETVPECGGDTLFADMYGAYESLSPALQAFVATLTARHDPPGYFDLGHQKSELPRSVHPAVRTHPLTGRRALYVNSGFTKKLVELRTRESEALLRLLFDHVAYQVDHQIRVAWRPGTVVIWDNRCVQHHAAFDYFPAVRHGTRVTTIGEAPVLEPLEA